MTIQTYVFVENINPFSVDSLCTFEKMFAKSETAIRTIIYNRAQLFKASLA